MFVVVVIGPISQVPHRSEANFRESCQGQDVILISSIVIHCVELPLKTLFIFRWVCELCLWTELCNILLPLKMFCGWLYDFAHLRVVYLYPILKM